MADEELGDEVKVFRRDEDADDDPMISGETSEQQLADDKKEAVMEAELDGAGRNPSIDGEFSNKFDRKGKVASYHTKFYGPPQLPFDFITQKKYLKILLNF